MSTLALITGAESLENQIKALAESEPHKAFLISFKLKKIAENLEKQYKDSAVNYWQENKELPAGFICTEKNQKKFDFAQDPKWQLLKSHLDAREKVLKESALVKQDYFDIDGEIVPKVPVKNSAIYSFSQK